MTSSGNKNAGCAVLYSGGTDSTCTAALMTKSARHIHLLTFYQGGKKQGCTIAENIASLRKKFPASLFTHRIIPTTNLVRHISYDRYFGYLWKHRWLVLSDCGFTTLSWHISTIAYCIDNDLAFVADGLTRELMHFPGHMDGVVEIFRGLYSDFGISYVNPVREWEIPPDRQFIDRLIVDQHGYLFPGEDAHEAQKRTTGRYLFAQEILPAPYVKGSPLDHKMQYDCYPFVLYNIMVFWVYLGFMSYEQLCRKMTLLFEDKVRDIRPLLKEYAESKNKGKLANLLDGAFQK